MSSSTRCRRNVRRHTIVDSENSRVEFRFPHPNGRPWSLPLLDVSVSGFSFSLDDELAGFDTGTTLEPVVLRIGSVEMHGALLVMHVSRSSSPATRVCGVLFYPAQDEDLLKLKSVIAGIEAVRKA